MDHAQMVEWARGWVVCHAAGRDGRHDKGDDNDGDDDAAGGCRKRSRADTDSGQTKSPRTKRARIESVVDRVVGLFAHMSIERILSAFDHNRRPLGLFEMCIRAMLPESAVLKLLSAHSGCALLHRPLDAAARPPLWPACWLPRSLDAVAFRGFYLRRVDARTALRVAAWQWAAAVNRFCVHRQSLPREGLFALSSIASSSLAIWSGPAHGDQHGAVSGEPRVVRTIHVPSTLHVGSEARIRIGPSDAAWITPMDHLVVVCRHVWDERISMGMHRTDPHVVIVRIAGDNGFVVELHQGHSMSVAPLRGPP